jgi:hypothetical protein
MVNEPLPENLLTAREQQRRIVHSRKVSEQDEQAVRSAPTRSFVQILGKLFFFKLIENLRGILLNYGQMSRGSTNWAFNGPC